MIDIVIKVSLVQKLTTFWSHHFKTISGYFIANHVKIFHTTEVQMIILRCLMSLNLNWIKSYAINYNFFDNCVNFGRKNWKFKFQKWPFRTFYGNFFVVSTYISFTRSRCWRSSWGAKHVWILIGSKSMTLLLFIFFFSCLKMYHFRGKAPK